MDPDISPAQDDRTRNLVTEIPPSEPSTSARLALYYHTIRHLRLTQIGAQIRRRLQPLRLPRSTPSMAFRNGVGTKPFAQGHEPTARPGHIEFLDKSRPFRSDAPDWAAAGESRLWRYNLHYFDYLGWPSLPSADKTALLDSWIAGVPFGAADAWEPYPISLRVVNWLKYVSKLPQPQRSPAWSDSLARQLSVLEHNLETHLLANHLVKNGKALLFGGIFLKGPAARRWLRSGLEIMLAQAGQQILADGGHVERSPMYHGIVLEDYLDAINLLEHNPGSCTSSQLAALRKSATDASAFFRTMLNATGEIPLFNDAAFGIAPPPAELLAYGAQILGETSAPAAAGDEPVRIEFPVTGYYGYRWRGDDLRIDCGPMGPDYQSGHAHCDLLSYELHIGGIPVVVDSGTFDYEPGALRRYLRGTSAHSTVRIDDQEQSQIWGEFRLARRARPHGAALGQWRQETLEFHGEHDGYDRLPGAPRHRREIRIDYRNDRKGRWQFTDSVTGRGSHKIETFVHLHPQIRCSRLGEREFRLEGPQGLAVRATFQLAAKVQQAVGCYCPRFGQRISRTVLVAAHEGSLPARLSYVLERL